MCWALLPARAHAMQKQHSRHFAPQNKEDLIMSNNELLEALNILEQEEKGKNGKKQQEQKKC